MKKSDDKPAETSLRFWKKVAAVTGIVAIGWICVASLLLHEDPAMNYLGTHLEDWLETSPNKPGFAAAVKHAGTNGIPLYRELLFAKDRRVLKRSSRFPFIRISPPSNPGSMRGRTLLALKMLGPAAKPAYPDLLELFSKPDCPYETVETLRDIDWPNEEAILLGLDHPSPAIRRETLVWLSSADISSPILTARVLAAAKDPDISVRSLSTGLLMPIAWTNSQARAAIEAATRDADESLRKSATYKLFMVRFREAILTNAPLAPEYVTSELMAPAEKRRLADKLEKVQPHAFHHPNHTYRILTSNPDLTPMDIWLIAATGGALAHVSTLRALDNENVNLRRNFMAAAWFSLNHVGGYPPDDALHLGLKDPNVEVRRMCLEIFNTHSAERNPPKSLVQPLLEDLDPFVRKSATRLFERCFGKKG